MSISDDRVDSVTAAAQNLEPLVATVNETAELLRCGTSKVWMMLASGELERRKVGRCTRVTMASIRKVAGL